MSTIHQLDKQRLSNKRGALPQLWKRRDIWQISLLFILFYIFGSMGLGFASTLPQSEPFLAFAILVVSAFAGFGSILWVNRWRQQHSWQALGFIQFDRQWLTLGTLLSIALVVGRTFLLERLPTLFPTLAIGMDSFERALRFDTTTVSIIAALGIVLVAPLWEEFFFRGFVHNALRNRMGKWGAIFVSSLLFGLFHVVPLQVIGAFLLALPLAWVYEKTGSLWLLVYIHMLNNLLALLYAYLVI